MIWKWAMEITKALEEIDVLTEYDKNEYQQLRFMKIDGISEKALLIDDRWIPKSQLRCDFDNNLYVANWLYDKL